MKRAVMLGFTSTLWLACVSVKPVVRNADELVQLEGDRIVVRESIRFEHGSADISSASTDLLDSVAKIMRETQSISKLTIVGHTDATGDPAANPPLSQSRAAAVKKYLESKGVDPNRLDTKGYGASQPVDTNDTDEGRAKNRRVEFRISQ